MARIIEQVGDDGFMKTTGIPPPNLVQPVICRVIGMPICAGWRARIVDEPNLISVLVYNLTQYAMPEILSIIHVVAHDKRCSASPDEKP